VSPVELTDGRGKGGGGGAGTQIILPRESLALYKSFNTVGPLTARINVP